MKYHSRKPALLLLEDGLVFHGFSIGYEGTHGGEICFNTGMTGYQEIYTDPSYYGQVIVNTTSHIGNYGVLDAEQESANPQIAGLVVNDFSESFSRLTASESLDEYLKKNKVVGICGIDTRKLVRHIRSKGAMNGIISAEILDEAQLQTELAKIPSMVGLELSSMVCTQEPYILGEEATYKVAVLDLGCKTSILKNFTNRDCQCKVFPAETDFEEINSWSPDGFFVSNGPGDPAAMSYAVETVTKMVGTDKPVFGICLGHQILALTQGISTYKMHHGHRGLNHPVKNLESGKSEITSQNHGFGINGEEVHASEAIDVTHVNLNDDTVEGIKIKDKEAFSVQYHPESSPGPHDSRYLFDQFIDLLQNHN